MKKKTLLALAASAMLFGVAGCANNAPYIGENGNWWVNSSDLGVPARGPQGETGSQGVGVSVTKVEKTGSKDNVDTYTIYFSDGTTTTFTVTNGTNGDSITVTNVALVNSVDGVDTYKITFSNGYTTTFTVKNGKDGKNLSVISIEIVGSSGLCDTYRINYSDGTYVEFVVTNGATPYIGDNGNWWINDVDTGVLADWNKANGEYKITEGLVFEARTYDGAAGYVVTDYDGKSDVENLVIPSYVGLVPVIGIKNGLFSDRSFKNVVLSHNLVKLGSSVFKNNTKLETINFNGASIEEIGNECFSGCESLTSIEFPTTLTKLGDSAFYGCPLYKPNIENIQYFGSNVFASGTYFDCIYLTKAVTYVGEKAFGYNKTLFVEHEEVPTTWGTTGFVTNCISNNVFIYSKVDGGASIHRYIGNPIKSLKVPSVIDGYAVKEIGDGFCNLTDYYTKWSDEELFNYVNQIKEIVIPNTVTKICENTFYNEIMSALVYIPSSVTTILSERPLSLLDDYLVKFIYESNELPTMRSDEPQEEIDELKPFLNMGVSYNSIVHTDDYSMFYLKENNTLTTLFYAGGINADVALPSAVGGYPVRTIGKLTFGCNLRSVKIPDSVTKIAKYAFCFEWSDATKCCIYIPKTVTDIRAYAFCFQNAYLMVQASSAGDDWDSNWNHNSLPVYYKSTSNFRCGTNGHFGYLYTGTEMILTSCSAEDELIYLPATIDGVTVTSIASNFVSSSYSNRYYFIPSTITKAEKNAFRYSSAYYVFGSSSLPSGFDSSWAGGTSSSYMVYGYSIPNVKYLGDWGYAETDSGVQLYDYLGDSDTIRIPRKIDNKTVTTLTRGLCGVKKATTVYIPSSVEKVGTMPYSVSGANYVFYNYSSSYQYMTFYYEASSFEYTSSMSYTYYGSYQTNNFNCVLDY